jgi:hypothetical protein
MSFAGFIFGMRNTDSGHKVMLDYKSEIRIKREFFHKPVDQNDFIFAGPDLNLNR